MSSRSNTGLALPRREHTLRAFALSYIANLWLKLFDAP
jgi:hypothetical protein